MKFFKIFILISVFGFFGKLHAASLAIGGAVGGDFPFAHSKSTDPGVSAEGFYRVDPYEIRFHYGKTKSDVYAVALGVKHFFTESLVRPYAEAALGPVIVDYRGKSLGYGVRPEVSLGADLGLSANFSSGVVVRYNAMMVFGDTASGTWESNHGLSMLANVILWF